MERKQITCPESAHLEEIAFERTPFGIVLDECSRFHPTCAVACAAECARRLDRRERLEADDWTERVLVLVAASDEAASPIAAVLADALTSDQFIVERADPGVAGAPPPADYDAIIVGATARHGRFGADVVDYLSLYRELLDGMPWFMFSVGKLDDGVPALPCAPTRSAAFGAEAAIAQRARILAFASVIADEVPAIGGP